jgi:hypothetical protein
MPANPQQHQQQHHLSACSSWQQGRAWLFAPATHTGCSSSTPARHLPGSVTLPSVQQQQQHPPPQQQLLASIQQQPSLSAAAAAAGRLSNLHGRRLAFIPSVTEQQPAVSTTSSSVASSSHAHGQQPQQQRSLKEALHSAGVRALGGGLPGAAAMVVQVRGCVRLGAVGGCACSCCWTASATSKAEWPPAATAAAAAAAQLADTRDMPQHGSVV